MKDKCSMCNRIKNIAMFTSWGVKLCGKCMYNDYKQMEQALNNKVGNMLFKPEHRDMILSGRKTQTRRIWKSCRVKVGGIYSARTKMLDKKSEFCKIRVIKIITQKLIDMSEDEAQKEGYNSLDEYYAKFVEINKIDESQCWGMIDVYAIEFEVVK